MSCRLGVDRPPFVWRTLSNVSSRNEKLSYFSFLWISGIPMEKIQNGRKQGFIKSDWERNLVFVCPIFETIHNTSKGMSNDVYTNISYLWLVVVDISRLGIQVWNSKNDFNMEALSVSCRNKHWSKYVHWILISSTCYLTICPPAPQRPGILWDNHLMKSKFDENILVRAYFCSLCWVPAY